MPAMYTMYDSVDVDQIPKNPHAVAAYINGEYANHEEIKKRFPHARILTISVSGLDIVADAYDIEKGDYLPEHVPHLYATAKKGGIWRPCFYAQLSGVMPAVKRGLNTIEGMTQDSVRLWVAYYDDIASLAPGYDAHQFTSNALGRNLDESLCASNFFQPLTKEISVPANEPAKVPIHLDITVEYDPHTDTYTSAVKRDKDGS